MNYRYRVMLALTFSGVGFFGLLFVDWRIAVLMFIWMFGNNIQQGL